LEVFAAAVTRLEPTSEEVRFRLRMLCQRGTMGGNFPQERIPMARVRNQKGFSLIELMIVVAIALIIAAFAVPQITETLRNYRLAGDARNIKSEILLAKMRAAARFTRSRVRADFNARTFQTDLWNKTTSTWDPVAVGAPQILSQGVTYGVAGMTDPPVDPVTGDPTQALLGQAAECTAGDTDDPAGGGDRRERDRRPRGRGEPPRRRSAVPGGEAGGRASRRVARLRLRERAGSAHARAGARLPA